LIISKKVSLLNTLGAGSTTFSASDIEELRSQPWTRRTGEFKSADFNVYAYLNLGGRSMSTYLFFESIPDEFFDIRPSGWDFDPDSPVIPIVLSKDYLTLYNFGFAATRGLPQLSEDVITKVPLRMRLSGNGNSGTYEARIVGFSSRLNTIAVPEAVMQWADSIYSEPLERKDGPSRMILEVTKPGDPQVTEFLDSHGYETAGDKADSSRAAFIFNLVTGIVIAIGAVITILAFFILTLSLYLLLQKNKAKLHDLMLLGYTPDEVAKYYCRLAACVNAGVLAAASAIMISASWIWESRMTSMQFPQATVWPTLLAGLCIMALISVLNIVSIRRTVMRAF
ncbi:MAG: ABC transporter permease, partial [Muribaculaceae bacterium]|nr:ABC transporter permease [Muribaculaceae bacterium]